MSNRLIFSVLVVAGLFAWYIKPASEEIRPGVVLAPQATVPASAVPQVLAFPRVQDEAKAILRPHSPVIVTTVRIKPGANEWSYK